MREGQREEENKIKKESSLKNLKVKERDKVKYTVIKGKREKK